MASIFRLHPCDYREQRLKVGASKCDCVVPFARGAGKLVSENNTSRISSAMLVLTLHGLLAGRNPLVAVGVAKGQRVWLSGNAPEHPVLCLAEFLDASSSDGNVDVGLCVMSVTRVARTAREVR